MKFSMCLLLASTSSKYTCTLFFTSWCLWMCWYWTNWTLTNWWGGDFYSSPPAFNNWPVAWTWSTSLLCAQEIAIKASLPCIYFNLPLLAKNSLFQRPLLRTSLWHQFIHRSFLSNMILIFCPVPQVYHRNNFELKIIPLPFYKDLLTVFPSLLSKKSLCGKLYWVDYLAIYSMHFGVLYSKCKLAFSRWTPKCEPVRHL